MGNIYSALRNDWPNMPTPPFCLIDNSSIIDAYAPSTSALQAKDQQETLDAIGELVRRGTIFVYTLHNLEEISSAAYKAIYQQEAVRRGMKKSEWRKLANSDPSLRPLIRQEYDVIATALTKAPGFIYMEIDSGEELGLEFVNQMVATGQFMQDNKYSVIGKSLGITAIFASDSGFKNSPLDLYTVNRKILEST
ncbi:hypothetical protein [Alicyclobacillus vulcanalis]|nr:hypothetical protein [Alicyclobacillus vulcanalis]